jgi:hypothetical protein
MIVLPDVFRAGKFSAPGPPPEGYVIVKQQNFGPSIRSRRPSIRFPPLMQRLLNVGGNADDFKHKIEGGAVWAKIPAIRVPPVWSNA